MNAQTSLHSGREDRGSLGSEDAIRAQIDKITSSEVFSKATKLRNFLAYIVDEELAGRAERLKAITIAQAVYKRGADFDPQSDPIVRVEAGRLRSRLAEYYASNQQDDPIIIKIPKGAYRPHFTFRNAEEMAPEARSIESPKTDVDTSALSQISTKPNVYKIGAVASLILLGAGLLALENSLSAPTPDGMEPHQFTENQEAHAMFMETRRLGRPPHIKARVEAAMKLAREIQNLDPTFGGGFASESFQYYTSVLFGHSDKQESDLDRGHELALQAITIDPEFAWGYQSLSRILLQKGDFKAAIEAAEKAVDLAPKDAEQQGNLGFVLALSGQSDKAIAPINIALDLSSGVVRTPYLNYLGIAYFHIGKFEKAIEVIEQNREQGGPTGPHMFAYLAAAHAVLGHSGRAAAYRNLILFDTSGFPLRTFIENHLPVPEDRLSFLKALELAQLTLNDLHRSPE